MDIGVKKTYALPKSEEKGGVDDVDGIEKAVISTAMTDKSPFRVPINRREESNAAKQALCTVSSDHFTLCWAYQGYNGYHSEMQFCNRYFLKRNTLIDIETVKNDLVKLVHSIGFGQDMGDSRAASNNSPFALPDVLDISKIVSKSQDLDQHMVAMVKAVLCAGLYSQVARVTPVDSAEASAYPGERRPCLAETAQGHTQVKVSRVYIRDTTLVTAYPLLLFGGDIKLQHLQKLLFVDSWIKYKAVAKTGVIFKELRTLFDRLLERKLAEPSLKLSNDKLIKLIIDLIKSEKPAIR